MNTFVQVLLGYMRQSLQLKELNKYYYKATGSHGVKNTLLIPKREQQCLSSNSTSMNSPLIFYSCRVKLRCYFFGGTHSALFYTATVHCLSNSTQLVFFARNRPKIISLFKDLFPSAKAVEAKITLVVWQVSNMNFIIKYGSRRLRIYLIFHLEFFYGACMVFFSQL